MQLLYGNDGINYRTIDKSPDMSEGVEKAILGTYSKYEFVSNPRAYSNEPEAVTYVTSNLDRQLPEDRLVVCKAGHMRNFSSPSYYLHCLVKDVPDDFYGEQFFEIFNYQFISDYDIERYGGGTIDQYTFSAEIKDEVSLTNEQLIVILASFMSNEHSGQKTKILVDATGDAYNDRSRAILASIYHYLPPALRKSYGFKTYCQDGKNLPARVSFALFNRDEVKDDSGCITLQETVNGIRNFVEEKYIEYATFLVAKTDDESRKKHFGDLSKLEKNGWLAIDDCVLYYTKLKEWENGTQEELLPDWIQYIDQNSFLKGPLYERLLEIIVSKVDNKYYNTYLFDRILKLYNESIYSLSPMAAKTLRFADCLDEIFIEKERFHEWYQSQLRPKLETARRDGHVSYTVLKQIYSDEIEALKAVDIMSQELTDLLHTEIDDLSAKLKECEENLADQQGAELETVSREVMKLSNASLSEFCDSIAVIWNTIRFPETRTYAIPTIEEWVDEHVRRSYISTKELEENESLFIELKDKLSPEKYDEYIDIFEAEKSRLEEEKKSRFFTIDEGELLNSYKSLVIYLDKGVLESEDDVNVRIGKHGDTRMKAKGLQNVLEFILQPDSDNCLKSENNMVLLAHTDVFTAAHLPYILKEDLAVQQIEEILDYYFESGHQKMVSGRYVGKLVKDKYESDVIKALRKEYKEADGELALFYEELSSKAKENPWTKDERWDDVPKSKPEKRGGFGFLGRKK